MVNIVRKKRSRQRVGDDNKLDGPTQNSSSSSSSNESYRREGIKGEKKNKQLYHNKCQTE